LGAYFRRNHNESRAAEPCHTSVVSHVVLKCERAFKNTEQQKHEEVRVTLIAIVEQIEPMLIMTPLGEEQGQKPFPDTKERAR
jgi:hypothetical protein